MSFIIREEAFVLLSGQLKTFTRTSDSGRPVVCAFCPDCGTRIYNKARWLSDDVLNIKPGTFDDTSFFRPTVEIMTVHRQPWLAPFPNLKSFAGQPVGPPQVS
jgi:hypothetical protein